MRQDASLCSFITLLQKFVIEKPSSSFKANGRNRQDNLTSFSFFTARAMPLTCLPKVTLWLRQVSCLMII